MCTPVFPTMHHSSSSFKKKYSYEAILSDDLEKRHHAFAAVPVELCPASPSSEVDQQNVETTRALTLKAVVAAQKNPASQRWAHVQTVTALGCTHSSWRGVGRRVSIEDEDDFEWYLAETEEQYEQWEARQKERRLQKRRRTAAAKHKEPPPGEPQAQSTDFTKQAMVEALVNNWQSDIVQDSQQTPSSRAKHTVKSSQLGFTVSKLGSVASVQKKGNRKKLNFVSHDASHNTDSLQNVTSPSESAPKQDTSVSDPVSAATRISQVSSENFLPPSFQEGVVTSTPPPKLQTKTKPPVIPHAPSHFAVPPKSPVPFAPSQVQDDAPNSPSPPLPSRSTNPEGLIRPQEPDSFDEAQIYAPSGAAKRLPPPTPLTPVSSPPRVPVTLQAEPSPEESPPGLGNALGIIPVERGRVRSDGKPPQVLATSHRIRPRPRPPSRSRSRNGARVADEPGSPHNSEQSVASKVYFSSPASSSPESVRSFQHSPQSPLVRYDEYPNLRASPDHGGVGIGDLVYSSQFNLEERIERFSQVLEQDIDFDQWLSRTPPPNAA